MAPIRGLLFDKDGTLFDFAATWSGVVEETLAALTTDAEVLERMARAIGYDRTGPAFVPGSPVVAGTGGEIAAILATHVPGLSAAAIEDAMNHAAQAVAAGAMVPAVPDLPGFLAGLRTAGYRLGIATHDTEAAARTHMEVLGAHDHFDFIAGYDSGHGHKPGPGMLLAFAAATGLTPAEIAMIGDSVHDLGVAPAAGAALAIGVLTGPATQADLAPHADHVLDSIADLPALLATRL